MKVIVYVEGPSDRLALEAILRPLIEQGGRSGVGIRFLPLHGKEKLLNDCPQKAARQLSESPDDWIFALPDLYPLASRGSHNAHQSFAELALSFRT